LGITVPQPIESALVFLIVERERESSNKLFKAQESLLFQRNQFEILDVQQIPQQLALASFSFREMSSTLLNESHTKGETFLLQLAIAKIEQTINFNKT
jgi:hypothetical protein